jgi:ubiquitin-protein ligase E3 C
MILILPSIAEFGKTKSIDLIPNGSSVPVTKENRLQYIQLVSFFRLDQQIKLQSQAFLEGLGDVLDKKWLRWVLHLRCSSISCADEQYAKAF